MNTVVLYVVSIIGAARLATAALALVEAIERPARAKRRRHRTNEQDRASGVLGVSQGRTI